MTAETVVVLPVLAAVTLAFAWVLGLGVAQVRVVDAAREAARAAARDEATDAALALGRRVAPTGSRVSIEGDHRLVRARVVTQVRPVQGLLGFLPPVEVDAEAVAAREPW